MGQQLPEWSVFSDYFCSHISTTYQSLSKMADAQQIQALIMKKDSKFQNACAQVLLLNNMVQDLQTRYDRAVQDNRRQYRCTLRLRLCTVEGLRNMYYEYACQSADEIEALEDNMRQLGVEPMSIYS
jgi:hypothetical protein